MTIRSSKRVVAQIAAAFVAVDVVVGFAGLLLGQAAFLPLIGLVLVSEAVGLGLLLPPVSLTFDGADVIYRAVGREKRTPAKDIAGCAQVGPRWVFSDSAGAQLITLNGLLFPQAAVADFCSQARINLEARPLPPVDLSRQKVSSAKVTRATGVVLTVILLVFIGVTVWAGYDSQAALQRYQAAPACAQGTTLPTSGCRLETQGHLTSADAHQSYTTFHLTLVGSGGDYVASLDQPGALQTGDLVEVEVWRGDVSRINGQDTAWNPERSPNLNLNAAYAVLALFAALTLGAAVAGHLQLRSARASLRAAAVAESGSAGPVEPVLPAAPIGAGGLPPCGINHHPKEVFFAHWDPKTFRNAGITVVVIALVVLGILGVLAATISLPIFGGIVVLGLAWFGLDMFGEFREMRVGGVFADDLHVGKISTSNGRLVRKVFARTSVLECNIGQKMSVVGVDGSTLFWTTLLSDADVDRFAEFIGCRVVRDAAAANADGIATPPVRTPLGVLPVRVRRAAGLMQAVGGLFAGLSLINLPRFLGLSADLRMKGIELLGSLVVYGLVIALLGLLVSRGLPRSRDMALIGGGIATVLFLAAVVMIESSLGFAVLFGAIVLPVYALVFFWLRKPLTEGPATGSARQS